MKTHSVTPLKDGTDTGYRNTGSKNSDAGQIPRRIHFKTQSVFCEAGNEFLNPVQIKCML
jgi:hypothetical protein